MKTLKFLACRVLFMSATTLLNAQAFVVAGDDKSITCDGSVQLNAESFLGGVWEQLQSTPKAGNTIYFVNDSIGYLATTSGTIIKTVDACKTWATQNSGTTIGINAIRFLDKNIGFAVGGGGTLLRTKNGGDIWEKVETNILNQLSSIYILSPDKIFVASSGGKVLVSEDGGDTWTIKLIDTTPMLNFSDITFSSPNVGYVVGNYGLMFKTVDGGQSWSKQNLPFANSISSISFLNDSIGIAVGKPNAVGNPYVIYKTQNGGLDWFKVIGDSVYGNYTTENDSIPSVNGIPLTNTEMNSVYFVNEKNVFIAGYLISKSDPGTFILKSTDGGNNWRIDKIFPGKKMYDAYFPDAKNGYVCGGNGFLAKYTATPSSSATFSWYPTTGLSDAAIANPIASPTETTKYYVTSTNNGSTTTDSLTVNLVPLKCLPSADKAIGCEGSVQLDSVKSNYSGSAPLKYRWTPSAGLDNDSIQNPIATVTSNTTYTYSVTTPSGCTASDSLTVKVNGLTVDAGNDKNIICGGMVLMDSITTNYSGSATLRYKWTPSTGLSNDTIPNPICSAVNNITYTVHVNSGLENCAASASVRVNVTPLTVNAGVNKSVVCGTAVLMDSISTNYTGTEKLRYKWYPAAGLNNDTIARPTFTGNFNTNYTVTVITPEGCTGSDNVAVNVNSLYVNVGADRSGVCGSSVQLGISSTNYTGMGLKYKWSPSTGLSNDTIANPVALVSRTNYTLTVTTSAGCSASDNVAFNVTPMSKPSLSYIGVNGNNYNQLYWTTPYSAGIEMFNILRETNVSNVYSKIGSVPFGAKTTFIDTLSMPDVQSNKYKITIVEQCGGETALSDYHKTLHLSINKGINTIWNLNWEPYEGFVVSTYNIYRGATPTNMQLIGSMSGSNSQFSDYTAPTGSIYYQIEALGSGQSLIKGNLSQGMKAQSIITSRSNIASSLSSGVKSLNDISDSFVIFPNPATTNYIYVKTDYNAGEDIQMNIINGLGQVMKTVYLTGNKQQIDISTLSDGLYLMIFNTRNMIGKHKLLIQR